MKRENSSDLVECVHTLTVYDFVHKITIARGQITTHWFNGFEICQRLTPLEWASSTPGWEPLAQERMFTVTQKT